MMAHTHIVGVKMMDVGDYHIEKNNDCNDTPIISVVMPTFNAEKTIEKSIESIMAQSFKEWEMLIINDFGSNDRTAEIVKEYMKKDPRIMLVQTHKKYGLSDSLNLGITLSRGKYIARMDSDDISKPSRFIKQYKLMENNENVGICGTWQRHIGSANWTHRAAKDDNYCKAHLLFWCDLCHSTLMLRKKSFTKNNLYYNKEYKAEDYELWTRAARYMEIRNIPRVLGLYSEGTGITAEKMDEIGVENGIIVSNNLQYYFDIRLDEEERQLFNQWNYQLEGDNVVEKLSILEKILRNIWISNDERKQFDDTALLKTIATIWYRSRYGSNIGDVTIINPKKIDDVFNDRYLASKIIRYRVFRRKNKGIMTRIRGFVAILFNKGGNE